jgi:predicted GNAT family acetyltransferase
MTFFARILSSLGFGKVSLSRKITAQDVAASAEIRTAGDRSPYRFGAEGGDSACNVFVGDTHVASFEALSYGATTLRVDHFATTGNMRGKGLGEPCLRTFAQKLALENISINIIQFDLGRVAGNPSQSDIQDLADAREKLLTKIGALNITKFRPNNSRIVVQGTWNKASW